MYLHKKFDWSGRRVTEDSTAGHSTSSPVYGPAIPMPRPLPCSPFQPMTHYRVIDIHLFASPSRIRLWSKQVDQTKTFSIVIERDPNDEDNTVIQIELTQPEQQRSIVLLFQTRTLPRPPKRTFFEVRLLLKKIFYSTQPIFTWTTSKLDLCVLLNRDYLLAIDIDELTLVPLSHSFKRWYNSRFPHAPYCPVLPEYEADDPTCTCSFRPYKKLTAMWTLENALQYTFNECATVDTNTDRLTHPHCLALTKLIYLLDLHRTVYTASVHFTSNTMLSSYPKKYLKQLQRNRELSSRPLFIPVNTHVHHFVSKHTATDLLHWLIYLIQNTASLTLSTACDVYTNVPALFQIEIIRKKQSVVVLIETCHLPHDRASLRFWLIRSLVKTALSSNHTIYAWGDGIQRLSPFLQYGLFTKDMLQQARFVNVQAEYREFDFRLFRRYRTGTHPWSLQEVIADLCNQFLDKQETLNTWSQGFDRPTQFIHPRAQQPLVQYAVHQCLAVTRVAYILDKDIFGRSTLPSSSSCCCYVLP